MSSAAGARKGIPLAPTSDIADPASLPRAGRGSSGRTGRCPSCARSASASAAERPLDGIRVAACLHVTAETANLVRTLVAGGAEAALCAANPLSTQDDVAAALAGDGIEVRARRGEDADAYAAHVAALAAARPQITIDDGADLVSAIHARGGRRARRADRRHRGDDDGPAPRAPAGGRGPARLPGARGQRGASPSGPSTTATARASPRSTGSCAPPTCCSPARRSSWSATAGPAGASRSAPGAPAPP